jgi:hypothetical protein
MGVIGSTLHMDILLCFSIVVNNNGAISSHSKWVLEGERTRDAAYLPDS